MYPDATFTMRVSYGNVKSYNPRDAVHYNYVCTLTGVMEKYQPGNYEFDLPANLIQAYQQKNFGQYKDAATNDIVVNFITTNDITGGNSGSPVLNGNGELIGLALLVAIATVLLFLVSAILVVLRNFRLAKRARHHFIGELPSVCSRRGGRLELLPAVGPSLRAGAGHPPGETRGVSLCHCR